VSSCEREKTALSLGALAHLGLAPAYALSGDTTKAKTAYQGFFTLWKGADPDIPVLKEAKAEYAKLRLAHLSERAVVLSAS
jgi:hypothetical protein